MEKTNRPTNQPATSKENTMTTINTDETLTQSDRDLFTARAAAMTKEELEEALEEMEFYSGFGETSRDRSVVGIYQNELVTRHPPKTYSAAELRDIYCVETVEEEFARESGLVTYADLCNL